MLQPNQCNIIGGMFGLEMGRVPKQSSTVVPPFLQLPHLFLVNARSALRLLVNRLKPPQVWLPSYLCSSMVLAVQNATSVLRFYPIDYNLRSESRGWIGSVIQGDMVIFVDYFGFPSDVDSMRLVRGRGAWVVEDACQALMSKRIGLCADYIVYSPRKMIGVPDGGILCAGLGSPDLWAGVKLVAPPSEWRLSALNASVLRTLSDQTGEKMNWFDIYQKVEVASPVGLFSMSEISKQIIDVAVDCDSIVISRRNNYQLLLEYLSSVALLKSLPDGVVPMGFPICLPYRDRALQQLYRENIYPPIHWRLPKEVPVVHSDSWRLSNEIMTIPCDQRYSTDDLWRVVCALKDLE